MALEEQAWIISWCCQAKEKYGGKKKLTYEKYSQLNSSHHNFCSCFIVTLDHFAVCFTSQSGNTSDIISELPYYCQHLVSEEGFLSIGPVQEKMVCWLDCDEWNWWGVKSFGPSGATAQWTGARKLMV